MLTNGYYPRIGGAERVLAALAPALRAKGVDIRVLTRRLPGVPHFECAEGIPVHRLPVPGPKPIASLCYSLSALRLIGAFRPDVVHAHDLFSTATTAACAKRRWKIPLVVTIHRDGPLGDIQRLRKKLLGARRWAVFSQQVDAFVTISDAISSELAAAGIPVSRRVPISNGVDVQRFQPASASRRRHLRTSLRLPGGPVVIFVGRLAPEKRVAHLLALWPEVRQVVPNALLLLLGDGPEGAALRRDATPGVRFEGGVEDVASYIQAADLFVLPSVAEGLSVAALEAQAAGLPVLMTEVGGARDMIEHGRNGWLVPPDDVAALRDALISLLQDSELRARLGDTGRRRVVENFALSGVAARLKSLYSTVVCRDRQEAQIHHRVRIEKPSPPTSTEGRDAR